MISTRHLSGLFFLIAISIVSADALDPDEGARSLTFYHTHTAEELSVTYYSHGAYDNEALTELNHFLRDFRTRDVTEMDPAVFDILFDIQEAAGSTGVYQIISAYRSPATNEMLRSNSSGVAKNSQHLQGKAIDVRLTDLDTAKLRDVAISLERGGVGYYPESDFVHVDTGQVRQW
jgi:uncharacterized protein YcbK (DUF882 family)